MIVDHCIRYMHATRHLAIKFDVSKDEKFIIQIDSNPNSINQIDSNKQMFETSVDASFANEKSRRSDEDYIFKLFDDLIDWAARKQVIISTSIIEAKLLAMLHAEKEFIWWIHLFEKLNFNSDQKIIIYNDNLQINRLLTSEIVKMNIKLRHVDIAQCWLRRSVHQEKIDVNYLLTAHMMIDETIKLLSSQRHKQFIQQLKLMNVKDLINWTARKQVIIFTSITEIELLAMLHADKEFIWWIHLFEKLRFNSDQKMIMSIHWSGHEAGSRAEHVIPQNNSLNLE